MIELMVGLVLIVAGSLTLYSMFAHGQVILETEQHRFRVKTYLISIIDSIIVESEIQENTFNPLRNYSRRLIIDPESHTTGGLQIQMEEYKLNSSSSEYGASYRIGARIDWEGPDGRDLYEEFGTSWFVVFGK